MMSDVCKHCESAPCEHSCPPARSSTTTSATSTCRTISATAADIALSACPFGVIGRAENPHDDGHAHKCTLCMDRQEDGLTPACTRSCPTSSIQFGPVEDLRAAAQQRFSDLNLRGNDRVYLYGCDSVGDYGPLNAFFLLEDHPNEYNLPVHPPQPFRGQAVRYAAGLVAGGMTAVSAWLFGRKGNRRG